MDGKKGDKVKGMYFSMTGPHKKKRTVFACVFSVSLQNCVSPKIRDSRSAQILSEFLKAHKHTVKFTSVSAITYAHTASHSS